MKKKTVYILLKGQWGNFTELGRFTSRPKLVAACKKHARELGITEMDAFKENAYDFVHDTLARRGETPFEFDDMRFFLENGWIEAITE